MADYRDKLNPVVRDENGRHRDDANATRDAFFDSIRASSKLSAVIASGESKTCNRQLQSTALRTASVNTAQIVSYHTPDTFVYCEMASLPQKAS